AGRQRPHETPQHHCGVVTGRQAVHHPDGALRAAIARIRAESREWQALLGGELPPGGLPPQADLPVTGVRRQRVGVTPGGAHPAVRPEHQKLRTVEFARIPTHARVLRETEDIAAWTLE